MMGTPFQMMDALQHVSKNKVIHALMMELQGEPFACPFVAINLSWHPRNATTAIMPAVMDALLLAQLNRHIHAPGTALNLSALRLVVTASTMACTHAMMVTW
jgi:hypothetical protein